MKKITIATVLIFHACFLLAQNLITPIEGTYGVDYIIVNYPDWHITKNGPFLIKDNQLRDHNCGTKTYDGHQGTDFVISGFPQMDAGVFVVATGDGKVFRVIENKFDRETGGVVAKKLGNFIEIYHASSDTWSYYAHLKKNSAMVNTGDNVVAGQRIAQVGSSGNSTDAHLHYELWNSGAITDPASDPWGSPCSTGTTLWANPAPYDTDFAVWETGLVNYGGLSNTNGATWNPLRERTGLLKDFVVSDPNFTFFALQYGLKNGDNTKIEWYDPIGTLHSSKTTNYTKDWWFHYYSNTIPTPPASKQGVWTVKYYYNGTLKHTKDFGYGVLTSVNEEVTPLQKPYYYQITSGKIGIVLPQGMIGESVNVYSVTGKSVITKQIQKNNRFSLQLPSSASSGIYFVSIQHSKGIHTFKVVF